MSFLPKECVDILVQVMAKSSEKLTVIEAGKLLKASKGVGDFVLSTPDRYSDARDNLKVREILLDCLDYTVSCNSCEVERDRLHLELPPRVQVLQD